jgi:radical SAM protein with 4Fe4S-binding SPASM domain
MVGMVVKRKEEKIGVNSKRIYRVSLPKKYFIVVKNNNKFSHKNLFSYKELFLLAIEKPIMAQIEITRNCNHQCFFCCRKSSPQRRFTDKSLSEWKIAIDKLVAIGVREVNFTGGEPFLVKKIDKLFRYAKSKGIKKIMVNTNGSIDLRTCDLSNVDVIIFSVHGIENIHDQITGVPGSFKKVIKAIKYAINQKIKVGINTVVVPQNIALLEDIYEYFKDFNLIFHAFNMFIDRKNFLKKLKEYISLFPKYIRYLETIPEERRKLCHGMQNIIIKDKKFFDTPIPLPLCAGGKYKLVIDYQGNIYPCRYFQTKQYYCGNIFKDDLAKVWKNGKGFKIFRDIVLKEKIPPECKTCFKVKKCLGGCLIWRVYNKKTHSYEKDIRCEIGNTYIRS